MIFVLISFISDVNYYICCFKNRNDKTYRYAFLMLIIIYVVLRAEMIKHISVHF